MKRLMLVAVVLCVFALSLGAQTAQEPVMFLEMTETGLPENQTVGVMVRVRVADRDAALVLKDELAGRFFAGIPHQATLHIHRVDGPCEVEPL